MKKSVPIASCLLLILALLWTTRLILRHVAPDAPLFQQQADGAYSGVDDRGAPPEAKKNDSFSEKPTVAGDRSSWSPVLLDPDKEAKEEEFTTLTDRRNQKGDPASFHYFAEVPLRSEDPRWDILVELEGR